MTAYEAARKIIGRDKETPPDVRRIQVGRGGLLALAQEIVHLQTENERLNARIRLLAETKRVQRDELRRLREADHGDCQAVIDAARTIIRTKKSSEEFPQLEVALFDYEPWG